MPLEMNKHEDIAKALKIRLSELTSRVAQIDSELRKPLSVDSEDRATDLENQDALEGIEISEIREIQQIGEALKRIAEGTYGICSQCGGDIDPKRLKALPTATRCISLRDLRAERNRPQSIGQKFSPQEAEASRLINLVWGNSKTGNARFSKTMA